MTIRAPQQLLPPNVVWVDPMTGQPSTQLMGYMRELDATVRRLLAMTSPVTVAELSGTEGDIAYASDGRKAGEGAGSGTGVLAFHDGTNWIAVDTGAAVAA